MSTTVISRGSICARVAERLAKNVGAHRYSMWFDRSTRLGWDEQQRRLDVAVPNRFVADWIDRNFQDELRLALRDEVGEDVDLSVHVDPQRFERVATGRRTKDTPDKSRGNEKPASSGQRRGAQPDLALRYKLEEFIVGPNNELAFAAANRLIENDSRVANPLFVHGGCGMGKTHLLQGICKQILDRKPDARVRYTTGEQFTNDFVDAIRSNHVETFRRRVRGLDLLAVDDVHFLSAKPATQQQFLHSFDAIGLNGSRVVMASDSHPKSINQFSKALVSRCMHGMVVQIRQPDMETRIRIIRALAQRRGISLLETVVAVLARQCQGSVREIEGTLTKLQAIADLAQQHQVTDNRSVTVPAVAVEAGTEVSEGEGGRVRSAGPARGVAERQGSASQPIGHALLNRLFNTDPTPSNGASVVRLETVLTAVTQRLQVSREQIIGKSRHRMVVLARALTIYLVRQMTSMSYPEIAAAMGRPSHSTVIAAAQRVKRQLTENARVVLPDAMQEMAIADLLEQLKETIRRS